MTRTQEELTRQRISQYIKQHMKSQCEQIQSGEAGCTHIDTRLEALEKFNRR